MRNALTFVMMAAFCCLVLVSAGWAEDKSSNKPLDTEKGGHQG